MLGYDISGLFQTVVKDTTTAFSSSLGTAVGNRLTPTQKSIVQQVTNTTSSVPRPLPKKTFLEENGAYLIIGGAVLVGLIIMTKNRRSTSAPISAPVV